MNEKQGLGALAILILLVSVGHTVWILQDHGPMPSPDEYAYLRGALRLADTVSGRGPAGLPSLDELSPGGRPPLYQVITVPFLLVLGRSTDAANAVNVLFLVILLITTYLLARRRAGAAAGLLACTLVATFPPIIHLLRTYRALAALPACGALSLWLLVEVLERRKPSWAIAFWMSFLFGAAMHPAFIYTMVIPTAFGTVALLAASSPGFRARYPRWGGWLGPKIQGSFVTRGLVPGILLAAVPIALWYLGPGRRLYSAMIRIAARETLVERGLAIGQSKALDHIVSPWWYLATTPKTLGIVVAVLALPAVAWALIRHRRAVDLILPATLLSTSAVLTFISRYHWKYYAPALPALAVLLALLVTGLRPPFRMLVASILVATSVLLFTWTSWGTEGSASAQLAGLLGAETETSDGCRLTRIFCPQPPNPRSLTDDYEPVLEYVLRSPFCRDTRRCQLMVVGKTTLSSRMFSFLAIQRWPHSRLRVVGQGTRTYGLRFPINRFLNSTFIVFRPTRPRSTAGRSADHLETINAFLRRPPPAFMASHQRIKRFATASGPLVLIRRNRAALPEERDAIIQVLGIDANGQPLASIPSARERKALP